MRRTVAAVIADGLARAGATRLFAAAGLPRALLDAARAAHLDVVNVATPYGACLMAAATGELTERPGLAWASLGDAGVAPLVDGLAAAARDRVPMILVTDRGPDAPLLAPAARASVALDQASAGHWIAHASRACMNEPRGAVHVAVDVGALGAPTVPAAASGAPDPPPVPAEAALAALAEVLADARRPLLVTGLGCRAADAPWVRALAEAVPAPVLTTPKGKGVLPDPHPLALGAWSAEHPLARRATLLLALGVAATEVRPAGWPLPQGIATLARSNEAPPARLAVVGDIAAVLEELAPRLRGRTRADWDVAELDRVRRAAMAPLPERPFSLSRAVAIAREMTTAATYVAFESSLAEGWQALAPHECLVPAGYATAGYALPAAIASALATGCPAVAFTTTRSAALADEWPTLARLALPIVAVGPASIVAAGGPAGVVAVTAVAGEIEFRRAFEAAWRSGRPALLVLGEAD